MQTLNDCNTLALLVSETPYKLTGLTKVIKAWYKCQAIQPEYIAEVDEGNIGIGGLLTFLQTTPTALDAEQGTISNEAHRGLAPGVGIRYEFPGFRRKYTLKAEVLYHSFNKAARLQTRQESTRTVTIRREFSASVIQFNLLAEMLLFTGQTSVYVEGGVASSYLLDSDQSQMQIFTSADGAQFSIDQDLNVSSSMANEIGWLLGIGMRHDPFQLGARVSRVARLKGNGGIGFYRAGLMAGYWF
jgi:hypothetical protein